MLIDLPDVKNTLYWHKFYQKENGEWFLLFKPSLYVKIFENQEAAIFNKRCHKDWIASKYNSDELFNFFKELNEQDIYKIKDFIKIYSQYILIGKNPSLKQEFYDELDICMALDKNYSPPIDGEFPRTQIGEQFYQAKYNKCVKSLNKLKYKMSEAINNIPFSKTYTKSSLTYMPKKPNEDYYLPEILAKSIIEDNSDKLDDYCTVIHSHLTINLQSMKDLPFIDKLQKWQSILSSDHIKISDSVSGKNVYIIDDLYQSGISMWSFAKFLKLKGANRVFGLVCVKAGKDTDNQ